MQRAAGPRSTRHAQTMAMAMLIQSSARPRRSMKSARRSLARWRKGSVCGGRRSRTAGSSRDSTVAEGNAQGAGGFDYFAVSFDESGFLHGF